MCAFGLKSQNFIGKFINGQGSGWMTLEFLADLIVLAVHTTQVTSREENCSRSFGA
jgi:hypothetical protein